MAVNYSTYISSSELHKKADQAREEEKYDDALAFIKRAIDNYEEEKNYEGLSRAFQSRVLIYKHLFLLFGHQEYINLAAGDAGRSLKIAEEHNLTNVFGSGYFRLGEIAMLSQDYKKAIRDYGHALDLYVGTMVEKGDYRYHLGEALYKDGEKENGKEIILQGLKEIQDNAPEVDSFLAHVWESGCYMRLADLLRMDEPEKAKEYLKKAKLISDSDEQLVIRRRQIKELTGKNKIPGEN
jgi:tetratricopeptide (TPR) repeat protein